MIKYKGTIWTLTKNHLQNQMNIQNGVNKNAGSVQKYVNRIEKCLKVKQ